MRATALPWSRPATASQKSLMKFERRISLSVKISKPRSRWRARHSRIAWSSSCRSRSGRVAGSLRASSSVAGRRKLPTWSARYGTVIARPPGGAPLRTRPDASESSSLLRGAALVRRHLLDDLGPEVRGRETPEQERETDHRRQLLPGGARAARGERVKARRVSHQGQQDTEQHELRGLHVKAGGIHRAQPRLLLETQELGIDPGEEVRAGHDSRRDEADEGLVRGADRGQLGLRHRVRGKWSRVLRLRHDPESSWAVRRHRRPRHRTPAWTHRPAS